MQRYRSVQITALAVCAIALAGCDKSKAPEVAVDTSAAAESTSADSSLYARLGGKDAITAVIGDFVGNVAADKRINARFAKTDIPHLKQMLVDQVCQATGGPCTYTGKTMRDAHTGMKITEADFNALVEDLTKSLDKFKVPDREKSELLTALGGMKGDIVGV
ncbi:MAG: group 1 truncated hemoglobin [Gemmatimonadales bacterium]